MTWAKGEHIGVRAGQMWLGRCRSNGLENRCDPGVVTFALSSWELGTALRVRVNRTEICVQVVLQDACEEGSVALARDAE